MGNFFNCSIFLRFSKTIPPGRSVNPKKNFWLPTGSIRRSISWAPSSSSGLIFSPLLASPLTGLASLGPLKHIQSNPPQKTSEICAKSAAKWFHPPPWAIWGKFGFLRFSKIIPPLGGSTKKKVLGGYPQIPGGGPCQIWLGSLQQSGLRIQTNRQDSFIYIDCGDRQHQIQIWFNLNSNSNSNWIQIRIEFSFTLNFNSNLNSNSNLIWFELNFELNNIIF